MYQVPLYPVLPEQQGPEAEEHQRLEGGGGVLRLRGGAGGETGGNSSKEGERKSRRLSGEEVLDTDNIFPACEKFQPPGKLPSLKSVLGRMKHLCGGGKGQNMMSVKCATAEVAKEVYCKYYHDNICCFHLRPIERKIEKEYEKLKEGKHRLAQGREGSKEVAYLKELIKRKDEVFPVFLDPDKEEDKQKIKKYEEEWGVKMSDMEYKYLKDQRTERKMECDNGVDPVWFRAVMRRQRLRERHDMEYLRQREENFRGKNLAEIEEFMEANGEIPSSSEASVDSPEKPAHNEEGEKKSKKRKYEQVDEEDENDELPERYRHIRISERKVKEAVYQTYAGLSGQGLSVDECSTAIVMVGNGLFGRKWTKAGEKETFGNDTLPLKFNVIEALKLIEAQSLDLVVKEMKRGKEEGHMITLASDSTTRRDVGKFMGMGVHIGKEGSLTLPLLGIGSETKDDIAQQLSMGLEQLSICSGVPVKELLEQVDVLFTDSVEHNKGVNFILQEMFDLDKPPGQLFCGTHTCLGFSSAQNKVVTEVEAKMKLETVLSHFMVGMELDSKSGSLAGQALDMQLKLVAPEYKHKSWNYHGLYTNYLEQRNIELSLFSYKDARFGLLGRASAVLLHNLCHIESFLADHPHISNKLACLVRELMNLPHLKVVYACFALLGVHLVEPFYSRTIQPDATHSSLKVFYQGLYDSLSMGRVTTFFFELNEPHFPGVSHELFNSVKKSYGCTVLEAVKEVALEQEDDVLMLINLMLPELAKTLGRQRRDYGLDEENFPVEFR